MMETKKTIALNIVYTERTINQALRYKSKMKVCLYSKLEVENNGHLADNLNELEMAGFIVRDEGLNLTTGKKSNICKYRISDNYTRYYLKYIKPQKNLISKDAFKFTSLEQLPGWESILGLQFENLVMANLESLLSLVGLEQALITSAAPYFQNRTTRQKGCQIDFLIQTAKSVYVIEIKRRQNIAESVVSEVEEKISRLKIRKGLTIRPVLVYDGTLSKRIPADAYFSYLVSADQLLGR